MAGSHEGIVHLDITRRLFSPELSRQASAWGLTARESTGY